MQPGFETITEKKLAGKRIQTSLSANKARELWQSFMPLRKTIHNTVGTDLYSVQLLEPAYFERFDPNTVFEKWAAVEVTDHENIPAEIEALVIPAGLYAVFLHKGSVSSSSQTFQYIFQNWLPASGFVLDNRPHFEVMGEKYKNEGPDSEEEFWIPVKPK